MKKDTNIYWIKVKNKNNYPPKKMEAFLNKIKKNAEEKFPDKRWIVTDDNIDISYLGEDATIHEVKEPDLNNIVIRCMQTGSLIEVEPLIHQRLLLDSLDLDRPILYCTGRDTGVTTSLCNMAVYSSVKNKCHNTVILVNKYSDIDFIRRNILDILACKYPYITLTSNNKSQIKLDNGSSIIFQSHSRIECGFRGLSIDLILGDLAGFYKDSFYDILFGEFYRTWTCNNSMPPKVILTHTSLPYNLMGKLLLTGKYDIKNGKSIRFDTYTISNADAAWLDSRFVSKYRNQISRTDFMSDNALNKEFKLQRQLITEQAKRRGNRVR
jgi:hypothetical protein